MVVATLLLCGSAEFRHLGIMFRHANLAILEAIVLACGTATFVVGGLGWVITALGRASRRARDLVGAAQGADCRGALNRRTAGKHQRPAFVCNCAWRD